MREKELNVNYSKKKIIIMLVAFLSMLVIAGVAFAIVFTTIGSRQPGWYQIEVDQDEYVKGHENLFTYVYYYDGSSNEIKDKMSSSKQLYNESLKTSFAYYDDINSYDAYPSIALLNKHLGEDVTLPHKLYATLKTAYDLTLLDNNYSIFAGPLFSYWDKIASYDELAKNEDPLNNESNRIHLETLVNFINDSSNYSLTFKDNNIVNLSVSEAYKNYLDSSFETYSIVSLNALKNAFILDDVINVMKQGGFNSGYISDDNGLNVVFNDVQNIDGYLYDYKEAKYYYYGKYNLSGETTFVSNRRFGLSKLNVDCFSFVKDGKTILRSSNLNLKTGYPDNEFTNVNLLNKKLGAVETSLIGLSLASKSVEEVDLFALNSSSLGVSYTLNNEDKNCYANQFAKNSLTLYEEIKYNLITIGG